ncbi:MAG: pyruvate formate-lyase [Lachnospiraceae bacterium]|nr:pyruvate formate-lyase [Lachnospiraceae bacterium]
MMTDRIAERLKELKDGSYKSRRTDRFVDVTELVAGRSDMMKNALTFQATLENEFPYVLEGDRIGFMRFQKKSATWKDENGNWVFQPTPGNNTPDYPTMLNNGMDVLRDTVAQKLAACREEQREYYEAALLTLDAALAFADRARESAKAAGAMELYDSLCRVPHGKAESLQDACVFMKFMIFTLRLNNNSHLTLGRFDKYMRPFYQMDLAKGKTREELLELIEEFFLSLNFDTDLYAGVQVGDNGQSLVLGGCDVNGNDSFDDFSRLCMEASLELNLIDPKINLRVNKNTSDELLEFATHMTKQGMGFPQYSNDDIVIPGLIGLGYPPEDAADYVVAACWEFIIPGKGMEIPNIAEMNYPKVIERVTARDLTGCDTFEELMDKVREEIRRECDWLMTCSRIQPVTPSPYLSVFVQGCIESGKDVSEGGAIYNNFGLHGAGIATAADALAAIREVIYQNKEIDKETLLDALAKDFEGYNELRNRLLSCPKMGNNEDCVDLIACDLMETYSSYLNGKPNKLGGIFRAGTGSAHMYIYCAEEVGATADGRKAKEPYGSSFSPSLHCRLEGPLSCIQSFTKFDLTKIINGGPLTMEIHDTTFRNEDGIKKVAQLVKAFLMLGGHQLQLNSVNRDRLLDAQAHPENYKNLIVRVWGWSGYFTELDKPFQEHIIRRTEYMI